MAKKWTLEQEKLLIGNYPILPKDELNKMFPGLCVKSKASRLKLCKKGLLFSWRYEHELKLIELYENTLNADLAKMFNKTEGAVSAAAFKLNLKKAEDFMRFHSAKAWIKPGSVPFNKGKKQTEYMSQEMIERTKRTRFKKGNKPHNTYSKDGTITIRRDKRGASYKYIRVKIGKWIPLHVHIWEQEKGIVPAGHVISFKDSDTMNCRIENLELITMQENMIRNSGGVQLQDGMIATYLATKSKKINYELKEEYLKRPGLIELKRNQILLNREIRKKNDKV